MKIQISSDEIYEIKIPDIIENPNDFLNIIKKLNNISKLMFLSNNYDNNSNKDILLKNKTPNTKKINEPAFNSREKVLDIMQYFYHGTQEDRERISKITGLTIYKITNNFSRLKDKYNIQPNEIGLYPKEKGKQGSSLIGNWTIKSYTGLFDENGNQ